MQSVVGLLLVGTAILKAIQLVTEPAAALVSPLGSWFPSVQIGLELGVGLLVLSGFYWQQIRWLAVLLFAAFAAYSLILAMGGAASCGCFGPLKINPWWTLLLDLAVVVGLLLSVRRYHGNRETIPTVLSPAWFSQRAIAVAILGVTALSIAIAVRYPYMRSAAASGQLSTAGDLVILEPETWVGKPLPIADSINLDLSRGKWTLLVHRFDCPACQEAVPQYEKFARQATTEQIAFIEVPPYGETNRHADGSHARLSDDRKWFVHTPVEIQLLNGVVTKASTELTALNYSSGR
jgi:hypothetical protein